MLIESAKLRSRIRIKRGRGLLGVYLKFSLEVLMESLSFFSILVKILVLTSKPCSMARMTWDRALDMGLESVKLLLHLIFKSPYSPKNMSVHRTWVIEVKLEVWRFPVDETLLLKRIQVQWGLHRSPVWELKNDLLRAWRVDVDVYIVGGSN